MKNDAKPQYWNERARRDGKLAIVRKGYDTQKMKEITQSWWDQFGHLLKDSGDVLEVGCGWGRWENRIKSVADYYTGVDVSEELVDLADSKDVVLINPGEFPFPSNLFDTVVTITVLQHMDEVRPTIEEMDRVLSNSGSILNIENTTDLPDFRSEKEYIELLSEITDIEKVGEIHEGREVMSIFYGERI